MRKLASIQTIRKIEPIEGADFIELATINNWQVVVGKGINQVGDKVVYCEIDSFLPIEPEFEFLRKTSYKKIDDKEGFRLRTIKMRNKISQGLIIPLDDAKEIINRNGFSIDKFNINDDLTEMLRIEKYEPPIPANLSGVIKGGFPGFLFKTDEERIQNLTDKYEEYLKETFYVSEKLDGSSMTIFLRDDKFGICSRNYELERSDENTFWEVAKNLKIEEKLKKLGKNISIQGELIGEGIQKNPYKIKGQTIRIFNVFDIDKQEYYNLKNFKNFLNEIEIESVPILDENFKLPKNINDLIKMANGKSKLENTKREGLVIRSLNRKISFKVISNKFLLSED